MTAGFQIKSRQVDMVFRIEEVVQRGIDLNFIIISAQSKRRIQRFEAKSNWHHEKRSLEPRRAFSFLLAPIDKPKAEIQDIRALLFLRELGFRPEIL